MKEKALFDTGFLLALLNAEDEHHESCDKVFQFETNALLPDLVLPELAYLILRELDVKTLINFLREVANGDFPLERTTESDLERAAEILEQYADNHIDLVDAVIVTVSERLGIKRILTIDRRHFGAFKPKHCESFEIAP